MSEPFPLLFSPGWIGSLQVPNRLVLPPMLMGYGSEDGFVTRRTIDYYQARAAGGTGLVIVEASMPAPAGKMFPYYLDSSDDRYLPGLTELAAAIKRHGARAAIQLGDGGRETRVDLTGRPPMGPSPVAARKRDQPREMSHEDIGRAVTHFATAAHRAQRAGFDGVEIHGAHVYLLSQFLSGSTNFRTDEYGGSTENRFRIIAEIVVAAKQLCGDDFPIWLRFNAAEFDTPAGLTIEESTRIAVLAERAGYDAISITAGSPHYEATIHSMYTPAGLFIPLAKAIRTAVGLPVIVTGRLTVELGEQILARGEADFIAIGRGLMVDPEIADKARSGRLLDIVPCDCDLNCVNRGVLRDAPITCTMNPALGREREFAVVASAAPGNVVVVGGGPAGMEVARVAALRGHRVTLLEKTDQLGGQLHVSASAPFKDTIRDVITYYTRQLKTLGVDVALGQDATADIIASWHPEVVVLATGAGRGPAPGFGEMPVGAVSAVPVDDLLLAADRAATTVAIWGGDNRSTELADLLSERGHQVVLASSQRKIAPMMLGIIRGVLLVRLAEKNVRQVTGGSLGAFTADTVEVVAPVDGEHQQVAAQTVAFNTEVSADLALVGRLRQFVPRTYLAGSCVVRGEHQDAIADGARIGRLV